MLLSKTLYYPRLLSNWLISVFTLKRYVASLSQAKWDQDIDKFYFINMTTEYFICSYWKPALFEKMY